MIRSLFGAFRSLAARAAETLTPLHILISNDPASGIGDAAIVRLVLGCAAHAERVAVAYDLPPPVVEFLQHGAPAPSYGIGTAWLHIVPKIPGDPDAQGWHSLDANGLPDGFVSVEGIDLDGLSEVLSHEIAETLVDPNVNRTVRAPNGDTWPIEICDAVQSDGTNAGRVAIDLGDGQPPVRCANYVLPAYWWRMLAGPFDALGVLIDRLPAIAPAGYSAVMRADGTTVDVYGPDGEERSLTDEKRDTRSRIQVRLAGLWDMCEGRSRR